ncbi:DUF2914 domain-containing protein [Kordia jejudonensis]|uniref:DUF2914 domain-containing protein n=1 Tax=Kordia jejudonensis TaxID=1348245 RepID=UPI000629ABC3|nr:DUF2914 domain-containing protein [Kordia jejudonensis]
MKRTLVKFRNSKFRKFIKRHEKYAPLLFFIGGFIFDSLTLGRIDRMYDLVVLTSHMTLLTIVLYLFNLVDDQRWKNTFLERYELYFPLAIQFFFGGLSSAYVIYFSRSVSLSKTVTFFVILLLLLFANEFLKKRISNKYLQFSVYYFISFIFFVFMIPVMIKEMNTTIFLYSGLISSALTIGLIAFIYFSSPSTRAEIKLGKLIAIIAAVYILINGLYYFRMIPPVPLALAEGFVAHNITKENDQYIATYESDAWYIFWRTHKIKFYHHVDERVYVYSSIFAPTDLDKVVSHRWNYYNPDTETWQLMDEMTYEITGGRDHGYRGYTYKENIIDGHWRVDVVTTEESLLLGVIEFEIISKAPKKPVKLVTKRF